ncbi:TPA: hypothetical protein EYP44_01190 [Candidatus Bathyarchaeota archaeon]|nr:hypothetical protein [Candidatus Bathyarchaeota archaeon]
MLTEDRRYFELVLDRFSRNQRIHEIGNVKLGGQPGQLPTVLIGSVFHRGHKVVKDPSRGEVDEKEAERQIKIQDELSDRTGNPCMVDVVGETPEALCRYLDFVSSVTEAPLLLNGLSPDVRVRALRHAY